MLFIVGISTNLGNKMNLSKIAELRKVKHEGTVRPYTDFSLTLLNVGRSEVQTPTAPQVVLILSPKVLNELKSITAFAMVYDQELDPIFQNAYIIGKVFSMIVLLSEDVGNDLVFVALDTNSDAHGTFIFRRPG
jgi:hypothetical protein